MKQVKILYATTTGTARSQAVKLEDIISKSGKVSTVSICDIENYDDDQLEKEDIVIFLFSTYTDGKSPATASRFMDWISDLVHDFRVSKMILGNVKFSVFGLGGKIYGENFCLAAKNLHEYMLSLGANPITSLILADDASDLEQKFDEWSVQLLYALEESNINNNNNNNQFDNSTQQTTVFSFERNVANPNKAIHIRDENKSMKKKKNDEEEEESTNENEFEEEDYINAKYIDSDEEEDDGDNEDDGDGNGNDGDEDQTAASSKVDNGSNGNKSRVKTSSNSTANTSSTLDMEDLGEAMRSSTFTEIDPLVTREMVTKLQRKALIKEGYKIIGSHSAVKLCRWTKNQLRGRGGCYKHTFYGITSYQCMEATPSLACANKCVFCWRHHKNPVGKEWRWKTDDPEYIVQEAIEQHKKMINEMRGVPGVQPARLTEAFTVHHCALSLVGEPIMYPRINEMLKSLHNRNISTFLVTNAQFPDRIAALDPVTQLYVSVDAASKEALKAIDRPLFQDFWTRFQDSLSEMSKKTQRTVYRMTLVKSWNMEEVDGYVDLIEKGQPDFIEIKAVTYCGKSDASSLTMQNVPWHTEVCTYADAIITKLKERAVERGAGAVTYNIATEHEHSCCLLLAREDKFLVDGVWNTWIDYPKYNALIQAYYDTNGEATFTSTDYMAPTPSWALYHSDARGFDPIEARWRRNKAGVLVENEYKPSGSGCG